MALGTTTTTLMLVVVVVAVYAVAIGPSAVQAHLHHVVGGDRGWDPSTDIASWSAGKIFMVGDKLWFAYSAAQESVVELRSKEQYESCDVTNPIRMFTDGINAISLEQEGIRYFASSKTESCKEGLKLHVDVQPNQPLELPKIASKQEAPQVHAAGPITPSGTNGLRGLSAVFFLGLGLCFVFV